MSISAKTTGPSPEKAARTAATSVFLRSAHNEIVGLTIPYDGNAESGDAVGARQVASGALAWVIDVEGKGPIAAPAADALHLVAHENGSRGITNPATILSALHATCRALGTRAAATVFHVDGNTVTIGVAGVQAPIVLNENGRATSVDTGGMTLGFPFNPKFTLATIDLPASSILLAGSDGFFEAEDNNGELIDVSLLARILKRHREVSMASNLMRVLDAVREHSPRQSDDLSVVMLRCGEPMSSAEAAVLSVRPRISGGWSVEPQKNQYITAAPEFCGALS